MTPEEALTNAVRNEALKRETLRRNARRRFDMTRHIDRRRTRGVR